MNKKIIYITAIIMCLLPIGMAFDLIPLNATTGNMIPVISDTYSKLWTQNNLNMLYPTNLNNSIGIGTKTPQSKLEVNGTVFIGDPDYYEGTNPIDTLVLKSYYSPSLIFKQKDNPTALTRFWLTDDAEELHLLVTAGHWEHPFIFDEHGAFVADSVMSRTATQARNFYAKQDGTAHTPAYGKFWGNSGMFFDDDDVVFSVDRNERFRLGIDENEMQGDLNLHGNLYVDGNLNVGGCIQYNGGTLGICI